MNESAPSCEGDFVTIATCETPTEAHLLKETLLASGLAARVADANFLQANPWMSNAAGGVRVLVPASLASEARKTIEALDAGAFQIDGEHGAAGNADPDEVTPTRSNLRTFHIYTHSKRKAHCRRSQAGLQLVRIRCGTTLVSFQWNVADIRAFRHVHLGCAIRYSLIR